MAFRERLPASEDDETFRRDWLLLVSFKTEKDVLNFCFADLRITVLAFKGVDMQEGCSPYVEFIEADGDTTISSRASDGSASRTLLILFLIFISNVTTLVFALDSAFMVKIFFRWSAGLTST